MLPVESSPHSSSSQLTAARGLPFCAARSVRCRAEPEGRPDEVGTSAPPAASDGGSVREALQQAEGQRLKGGGRRAAGSTDWVSSQLTRRFGLAGGLAWAGVLTFGVVSEQVKTRLEQADEATNTKNVAAPKEITTPEGIRYTDLKVGGGAPPQKGYLMVLDFQAYADGQLFEDTKARGKPIVFFFGGRPFTGGVCPGVEIALRGMRGGGRRRVVVPPALGFGENGTTLRPTEHEPGKQGVVPPNAELIYELELLRVSIPPS